MHCGKLDFFVLLFSLLLRNALVRGERVLFYGNRKKQRLYYLQALLLFVQKFVISCFQQFPEEF